MALILGIDTSMENAALFIADGAQVLSCKTNNRQTDHASWLHKAINAVLHEAGKKTGDLQAVGVTSGPGSYTGLRVAMAAAKGLCYALTIPLLTDTTLHLLALSNRKNDAWICPMIDARRMEVFTALYDGQLNEKMQPAAIVLNEHSFTGYLDHHPIIFCGNGCIKWQSVCHHPNAVFSDINYSISDLARVFSSRADAGEFTGLAWSEPFYLKNVYTGARTDS